MKQIKRLLLRLFFATEIMLFAGSYLIGSNGLPAVRKLTQEITQIEQDIIMLTQDTTTLNRVIAQWTDQKSFFQEKLARENLQLARKGDLIYFVDSL